MSDPFVSPAESGSVPKNGDDDNDDNDEGAETISDSTSLLSSASKGMLYYTSDARQGLEDDSEEDDDEGGDDEDDEDEEEEEEEPKLKYERLSSDDLRLLLSSDSASCLCVHPRVLVLGTRWGQALPLDAMGNKLEQRQGGVAGRSLHAVAVSQVSFDHSGEYCASCSLDGRVVIRGLMDGEHDHDTDLGRAVHAVALDPIFARSGSGRRFMTGDDKLILHEKTLFSRYKQTVLCEGEGPVSLIKWRGRFAAWTTNKGVRVYDVVEEKMISLIKHEDNTNSLQLLKRDEVPFRIAWSDQFHLYVSLGDAVKVCVIKKRDPNEAAAKGLPEHLVEITRSFTLEDAWVCGLAPFDDNLLVLLTLPKAKSPEGQSKRPQVQVVDPLEGEEVNEISTDLLSIRGYEKYRAKDYHMECLVDDKNFFIVSPKDLVVAKPRDTDDHIDWLLSQEEYSAALMCTQENKKLIRRHTVVAVGRRYLDYLLGEADFDLAGKLCVSLFGRNRQLWQDEVFKFARLRQLRSLAPYLPRIEIQLEPQIYEMTLFELLKTDSSLFLHTVREWSPALYNVSAVVKPLVEELLINPDDEDMQRALATLFSYQEKYDKALAILLKLGHGDDVFGLIRQHRLFDAVREKITELVHLDQENAIMLFMEHTSELPPELVVDRLSGKELFLYLDALRSHHYEESKKFHGHLVALYADYNKPKLLPFLRSSDHYPIREALEICKERHYIEEQVFVLARMGSTREALALITDSLLDIHKAVEFCREHDDAELWQDLIEQSLDKPYFVNVLLHNVGAHIDPRNLISKIENGQEIPGLRDSLVQIMLDYKLQVSLKEGCKRILVSDCYSLLQRQIRTQNRGLAVQLDARCEVCNCIVLGHREQDLVVFRCRHVFHLDCLGEANICGLCNKKGSRPMAT